MFKTFFDNLKYRREKNIGGTIKRFVVNNIIPYFEVTSLFLLSHIILAYTIYETIFVN